MFNNKIIEICNLINYLKRKIPFLAILGLLFGLSSCGSYQYVGVDNDGIYGFIIS